MGQVWEVEFYTRRNGRCPTKDFLDSLEAQERVRVNKAIQRLELHGLALDFPHVKYLRDDIWELRVRIRRVRYRLFYFICVRNRFVLLHGIKKPAEFPTRKLIRRLNTKTTIWNRYQGGSKNEVQRVSEEATI